MKKLYTVIALVVIALLVLSACGGAAPAATQAPTEAPAKALKIGVVTDVGQLEDKSFNQASYEGAKAAAAIASARPTTLPTTVQARPPSTLSTWTPPSTGRFARGPKKVARLNRRCR